MSNNKEGKYLVVSKRSTKHRIVTDCDSLERAQEIVVEMITSGFDYDPVILTQAEYDEAEKGNYE